MDARIEARRTALLAEIGRDATLERSDFLVRAGDQLDRFMAANAGRIRELGGLTLIDDDPDYLAVTPDGTFRSRARVFDEAKNEWVSETEIIETAAELVEIYNPADILQAFLDAREGDGWSGADEAEEAAPADDGEPAATPDPYAGAADSWAAGQPDVPAVHDEAGAAAALYDLALDFQERSQRAEAGLLEQFENAASGLLGRLQTLTLVEDDDEQLTLGVNGFHGRVIPEGETGWQDLTGPDQVVRFYDPTDVFGDLAEAIVEAYPDVADEDDLEAEAETGDAADDGADGGDAADADAAR
jgi:hypothetical protein